MYCRSEKLTLVTASTLTIQRLENKRSKAEIVMFFGELRVQYYCLPIGHGCPFCSAQFFESNTGSLLRRIYIVNIVYFILGG